MRQRVKTNHLRSTIFVGLLDLAAASLHPLPEHGLQSSRTGHQQLSCGLPPPHQPTSQRRCCFVFFFFHLYICCMLDCRLFGVFSLLSFFFSLYFGVLTTVCFLSILWGLERLAEPFWYRAPS